MQQLIYDAIHKVMENHWKKYINYIEKKMDKIEWVI